MQFQKNNAVDADTVAAVCCCLLLPNDVSKTFAAAAKALQGNKSELILNTAQYVLCMHSAFQKSKRGGDMIIINLIAIIIIMIMIVRIIIRIQQWHRHKKVSCISSLTLFYCLVHYNNCRLPISHF